MEGNLLDIERQLGCEFQSHQEKRRPIVNHSRWSFQVSKPAEIGYNRHVVALEVVQQVVLVARPCLKGKISGP